MNSIHYETIEQYLNGELSGEALLAFETQLKTDETLAAEVKLYRNIQDELKQQQQNSEAGNALTHTLRRLGEQHFAPAQKNPGRVRKLWWAIAAVAAAAVVAFVIILNPFKNNDSNNRLFAEYAQPEALHLTERGNNAGSPEEKAAAYYNQKEYANALPLLKQMLANNPAQPDVQLAAGICQAFTGDYKNAVENFDRLAAGKSSYMFEAIKWKGLALLKQDKKAEAIETLHEVPSYTPEYNKVSELLGKLQR